MTYAPSYNNGELEDLIAAKDVDLGNEATAFKAITADWSAADPPTESTWNAQWTAVQYRYATARAAAQRYIELAKIASLGLLDYKAADATAEYNAILAALNSSYATDTVAPGSFDDLDARMRTAAASLSVPLPTPIPIPQPTNPTSGLGPTSWQAYTAGLACKLGLAQDCPPGTPGTTGAPPIIPTWLKWAGGGALVLWGASKLADLAKALK